MKKYFLLLIILPFIFGACKNNNEPSTSDGSILGSWHETSFEGILLNGSTESILDDENNESVDMVAKDDGTFTLYDYRNGNLTNVTSGTYTLNGSKGTLTMEGVSITATISTLNATTLVLTLENFNDPVINEYLGKTYSKITCSFTRMNKPIDLTQTWDIGATGTDNITATLSENGTTLTISGTGAMEDYSWNGAPWESFKNSIASVIIEHGVTSIGNDAFYSCKSLTSITIPNSVMSIGNSAFESCKSLPSVTIPNSVTSIGDNVFYSCESLTSVTISNSVISIGAQAFKYCESLPSITIPNSVTSIGDYAFNSCTAMTAINVDANNLNYSSDNGVLFNKNKTSLIQFPTGKTGAYVISNLVTSIGQDAFIYCKKLTSVTIPNAVISIGDGAFYGCSELTSITSLNPDPSTVSLGSNVFYGINKGACIVFVPDGSVFLYLDAPQWRDFSIIMSM